MMRLPRQQYYRMTEWRKLRKEFLGINTECECCGAIATEVHHDYDANYYYWTDEDFFNVDSLVPLCKQCHARITQQNRELRKKSHKM